MFHIKIKELRNEKKLTQQEVADYLGITRPAYTAYESGKRQPDFESLQKLATLFNVTTDFLLGRNHTPEWANKEEVMELDKILKSNPGMTYGSEIMTDEDREQINDLIASYFWVKKQKEARNKDGK
ncbi:helix-turn-helix domain-containing protein [Enterococcus faecalis]|uniref:helix-turn-helix domain-containing protein n=1 Tax=Enterococcus faecalis TaxID=1351 RepID=UPI00398510E4